MTTHPTKVGQFAKPLQDHPHLGLLSNTFYYVSGVQTVIRRAHGVPRREREIQLNNGPNWYLARAFEASSGSSGTTITFSGVTSKDQAEHLAGKSIRDIFFKDYDRFDDYIPTKSGKTTFTVHIETDPFAIIGGQVYAQPSRRIGKTLMAQTYSQVRAEYITAQRSSRLADLVTANSRYGKFGIWDRDALLSRPFDPSPFIDPIKEPNDMSIIPALEVPPAPVEPTELPPPPESASVQMLRKLLDERRHHLTRAEADKARHQGVVDYYEKQIAQVREMLAKDERLIAAATASIEETLADIAKLGGRPEPTPEV